MHGIKNVLLLHITNWYHGFTSASPQYNATTYAKNSMSSAGSMGEPNRQPPKAPNEKMPLNFYQ